MHYNKKKEVFYVLLPQKQEIKIINLHNFANIKTFLVRFATKGITNVNEMFLRI